MWLLMDTQCFLWLIEGNPKLSSTALAMLQNPVNRLFLSVASLWEIAIKHSIGKLHLAQPFGVLIPTQLQLLGIQTLSITLPHLAQVVALPMHHRDPFDRLIIAQSIVENLPAVGADTVWG